MKKEKKLLLCLIAVLLLVTSCGKVPKLENGQEAVVTLKKGESISVDDLYTEMKDKYSLSVLLDMVDEQLLTKIYPEDDEEKQYLDNQLEQLQYSYDSYYYIQFSSFEDLLYQVYGTDDKDEVKDILALDYKRSKATTDYIKKEVIKDEDIQDYYDKNTVGQMQASHILIKADYADDATDEEIQKAKDEAKKKAEDLIAQLNKTDKKDVKTVFADLAKKNSDDGSASKGGDLGWFDYDDMVEAFSSATKKLDVDAYTKEPVESEYGYHIILKTGQKEKPKLEDVKDDIIEKLADEKKEQDTENALANKALIALREEYGIEIQDKELKKQYKTFVNNNK